MDEELKILQKYGVMTSSFLDSKLKTNQISIIRKLNSLEKFGMVKIVRFSNIKGERRLYMTNEVYKHIFEDD